MDALRFAMTGSVDDGKSTLIGRLLYDSCAIGEDQLLALEHTQPGGGERSLNLARVTDGLRAERDHGMTIDVAYRYFATPARRFIVADTPGHAEYTRNMVTGASTADVVVVLIDARAGLVEQSRRHVWIAALMRVPGVVFCVNKMDLVDWSSEEFERIEADILRFTNGLPLSRVAVIPVCALSGDNVVRASARMRWYRGPTLLESLERFVVTRDDDSSARHGRFPVQYVVRVRGSVDRWYAGRVEAGTFGVGDVIRVLPAGVDGRVVAMETMDGPLQVAQRGMSVTFRLEGETAFERGDLFCGVERPARVTSAVDAMLCWMHERPATHGTRWLLKHTTRTVPARITRIRDVLDVNTLRRTENPTSLALNDLGRVSLQLEAPIAFDPYAECRSTGSFIVIDETTQATVGAGVIERAEESLRTALL